MANMGFNFNFHISFLYCYSIPKLHQARVHRLSITHCIYKSYMPIWPIHNSIPSYSWQYSYYYYHYHFRLQFSDYNALWWREADFVRTIFKQFPLHCIYPFYVYCGKEKWLILKSEWDSKVASLIRSPIMQNESCTCKNTAFFCDFCCAPEIRNDKHNRTYDQRKINMIIIIEMKIVGKNFAHLNCWDWVAVNTLPKALFVWTFLSIQMACLFFVQSKAMLWVGEL